LGLKGSLDISDISEISLDLEPEDEPQIGKKKHCFRFNVGNSIFYIAGSTEEEKITWFNIIKQQMAKIAIEYDVCSELFSLYHKQIKLNNTLKILNRHKQKELVL